MSALLNDWTLGDTNESDDEEQDARQYAQEAEEADDMQVPLIGSRTLQLPIPHRCSA